MKPTVHLRRAKMHDIPAILKLYEQPELDDGVSLSLDEAQKILSQMEQYPSYSLYVADVDGQILGSFALLIMDNLGHLGAPSAIVEDVVVSPQYQNRGIGKKMMQYAISIAEKSKCYKLTLSADCKRKKSHKFYESLGFRQHGISFRASLPHKNTSE